MFSPFLAWVLVAGSLAGGASMTQTTAPVQAGQTSAAAPSTSTSTAAKRRAARRAAARARANGQTEVIPMERMPANSGAAQPPAPSDAQQKAADQRLLQQQQAQSAKDAAVNGQVVKQAERQQDKVQGEVRIQDAPNAAPVPPVSPVQTVPQADQQRIQDAPGPQPTQNPVPATPSTPPQN